MWQGFKQEEKGRRKQNVNVPQCSNSELQVNDIYQ